MEFSNTQFVDGPNGHCIASDGPFGQVELVHGWRAVPYPFGLSLGPPEDDKKYEGEEGGVEEHDVPKDDILGIMSGGIGDCDVGIGRGLALGDGHVVGVEGSKYHGRHHEVNDRVETQLP